MESEGWRSAFVGTSVQTVRDLWSGALDLIYPPYCLVCNVAGEQYLCPKCIEQIDIIEPPYCRKCGIPCESYHCPDCRERELDFEYACSAGTYDGVLRGAIHALKYEFHLALAQPLGELMVRCFPNTRLAGNVDIAVPIPIHRSRMLDRGFNQASELLLVLSRRVSLPIALDVLYSARRTRDQVGLSHDERAENVKGAFAVGNSDKIIGKRVLLVDDVMTTGSTLNEAAKMLKTHGATQVYGYTLARDL